MEKEIQYIQNELWRLYKAFVSGGSMKEYNRGVQRLSGRYKGDEILLNFCQNLIISWAPIMNELSVNRRKKRNGQENETIL